MDSFLEANLASTSIGRALARAYCIVTVGDIVQSLPLVQEPELVL